MTKFVLRFQLEIPQIPHNFFGPSAKIGQLFGNFLKKVLITCPMSMINYINYHYRPIRQHPQNFYRGGGPYSFLQPPPQHRRHTG